MMTPLGAVASVSTAFQFRKRVEPEPGGDIAVIQIRDVNSADGGLTTSAPLLTNEGGKYDRYLLHAGDLLFQARGTRYPATVVNAGVRGIASPGLHVLRPDPRRVLPAYLAWWLNHPTTQEKLANEVARGSQVLFVSKRDLEVFAVPLPPIEVQQQIVDVDALRRRERELQQCLDKLTQQLVDIVTITAATRTH